MDAPLYGKEATARDAIMPSCRFAYSQSGGAATLASVPHTPRSAMPVSCVAAPGSGGPCMDFPPPLPTVNHGCSGGGGRPAMNLMSAINISQHANTPAGILNIGTLRCHQRTSARRSGSRSTYKHIPHREKAPHLVARRNARERRRVQAVNSAFTRLRRIVPYENKHKRLSKVKTLRIAIDYIHELREMLHDYDTRMGTAPSVLCGGAHIVPRGGMVELSPAKENALTWIPSPVSDDASEDSYYMESYSQYQHT